MREAGINFSHCITLPQNHEVMWTFNLFFKIRKLSSLCSLSSKLALKKKNPARVLLTWLLQCKQTLLDWSCVCETVKPRSLKPSANFHFVTPWWTLSKKDSLYSFTGTGRIPSTIEVYKAPTSYNNPMCRFVAALDLF